MSRGGSASSLFGSQYQETSFFWKIWEENPPRYWNGENRSIYLSYPARSDQWGLFFFSPHLLYFIFWVNLGKTTEVSLPRGLGPSRVSVAVTSPTGWTRGWCPCVGLRHASRLEPSPALGQALQTHSSLQVTWGVVASCSLALHSGIYNGFVALKKWN